MAGEWDQVVQDWLITPGACIGGGLANKVAGAHRDTGAQPEHCLEPVKHASNYYSRTSTRNNEQPRWNTLASVTTAAIDDDASRLSLLGSFVRQSYLGSGKSVWT